MSGKTAACNGKAYEWLVNCPADDVNFKFNLKQAAESEIKQAIEHLEALPMTKTQISALERELRRRAREKKKAGGNP